MVTDLRDMVFYLFFGKTDKTSKNIYGKTDKNTKKYYGKTDKSEKDLVNKGFVWHTYTKERRCGYDSKKN